jgi:hypothetical protein
VNPLCRPVAVVFAVTFVTLNVMVPGTVTVACSATTAVKVVVRLLSGRGETVVWAPAATAESRDSAKQVARQ